ncbi:uncharacterized protein LOC127750480 [Frankliniella occidentalis]|uniref:Uncharacterized protein LOC127750480 n=1 Tax=Frankliniella occidentalis TaxID=133901 RepID=A0A9C6X2W7_FRAOC|nr:uncharacterized protein LOC127750480 [Frankliniella occidentalis]
MKSPALVVILLAGGVLVAAAPGTDKKYPSPEQDDVGAGRTFSLVSLPSLLPSLISGPAFNLFNINKPPIVFGDQSPPGAGGFFGLPPSVWVVNSAGTSSGSPSATAGSS